jgi:hypothetical protein
MDDRSPRHPKVAGLSDKAFRAWVSALCYASEFLTDGVVPSAFLVSIPLKIRDELMRSGLWELSSDESRVVIHDYLHHQTRKEDVEFEKARNREKAASYRARKRYRVTGDVTGNVTGESPVTLPVSYQIVPNPESREQIQIQRSDGASRPSPLIRKRNLHAAFEHPRFDVPQWFHDEKVKGLPGGEREIAKFYDWLSARVERTNERTEPRKPWLIAAFEAWLAETSAPKSLYPTPEETRRMIAEREAMAGK